MLKLVLHLLLFCGIILLVGKERAIEHSMSFHLIVSADRNATCLEGTAAHVSGAVFAGLAAMTHQKENRTRKEYENEGQEDAENDGREEVHEDNREESGEEGAEEVSGKG
ncbi:MAG: hypothetical protein ACI4QT_09640 [Kiritimatiellia bacterium]